jgi:uncharacterized membrane protein
MTFSVILWTIALSLLPISELRGAIPYALYNQVELVPAFLIAVAANSLATPVVFVFLSTAHRLLLRLSWYRNFFERVVERARHKVKHAVDKYGYWGLAIFVAIPLPLTGAYTGALGAWVLGMDKRKAFLAVTAGVVTAGVVVSLVAYFGISAFSIFIKA